MLVQLTYWSRVSDQLNEQQLNDLRNVAEVSNTTNAITGCLVRMHEFFMQTIEGDADAVNSLYKKIINDPRHTDVCLVTYQAITRRKFTDWLMVVDIEKTPHEAFFLSYSAKSPFSFDGMTAPTIDMMIQELYATHKRLDRDTFA